MSLFRLQLDRYLPVVVFLNPHAYGWDYVDTVIVDPKEAVTLAELCARICSGRLIDLKFYCILSW
ncbi:MAG: hypothetical protein AB2L11_10110 [Syntrophobacteraceae bacterium]